MSLLKHLEILEDPRSDINKKHHLIDVVFLVFSAVLSGASGWKSIQEFGELQLDWLKQHRPFAHGIPKRHCIANIIKALNSEHLLSVLVSWINEVREENGRMVLAIDGKTMRSAWKDDHHSAAHVVSAFDVTNGLAFYQQVTERKGKEPEVALEIIKSLALKGAIVTLDALHCQSQTMNAIKANKGDFIMQLKANRRELFEEVGTLFTERKRFTAEQKHQQSNEGHGRVETRNVRVMEAKFSDDMKRKWPHIKTLVEVTKELDRGGDKSFSTRRYVSSLSLPAKEFESLIRSHWAIENNLHWVLDVVFREDNLKVKDINGAKHLAIFNRMALNMIKQHKGLKESMAAKRRMAAWSPTFRSELIMG